MRLWHYALIPYLPRKQLLSQWRECCAIAKSIKEKGTPNHILVNKITEYWDSEFNAYADLVALEMEQRGYKVDERKFYQHRHDNNTKFEGIIFDHWHNDRYLRQCMSNLSEKYDCGGITATEWVELLNGYKRISGRTYQP